MSVMCLRAEHWLDLMQCRLGCSSKVNVVNASSEPLDDYFIDHYNYLQFAYFKCLWPVFASRCYFVMVYIVIVFFMRIIVSPLLIATEYECWNNNIYNIGVIML